MELPQRRHAGFSAGGAALMWLSLLTMPLLYDAEVIGQYALVMLWTGWVGVVASGKLYLVGLKKRNSKRLDGLTGASIVLSFLVSGLLAFILTVIGLTHNASPQSYGFPLIAAAFGVIGLACNQALTAVIQRDNRLIGLAVAGLIRAGVFFALLLCLSEYGLLGLLVVNAGSQLAGVSCLLAQWRRPAFVRPSGGDLIDGFWLSASSLVVQGVDVSKNQLLYGILDPVTYGAYAHLSRLAKAAHQWPGGLFQDINLRNALNPLQRGALAHALPRQNLLTAAVSVAAVAVGALTLGYDQTISWAIIGITGSVAVMESALVFRLGLLRNVLPIFMANRTQSISEMAFGSVGIAIVALGTSLGSASYLVIALGVLAIPYCQIRWLQHRTL